MRNREKVSACYGSDKAREVGGLYAYRARQEKESIAVHVTDTCTERRRGIIHFWGGRLEHLEHHGHDLKRPGVLFAFYTTIYFIYSSWSG